MANRTEVRKQISGRGDGGSYRSRKRAREQSAKRREANKAAGRCINENKAGTHGTATHGSRCKACDLVHKASV
jgi:hypothetical protein